MTIASANVCPLCGGSGHIIEMVDDFDPKNGGVAGFHHEISHCRCLSGFGAANHGNDSSASRKHVAVAALAVAAILLVFV